MSPRSYLGTAVLVGALTSLPAALLFGLSIGVLEDVTVREAANLGLRFGILFGPTLGLVLAYFFRGCTIRISLCHSECHSDEILTRLNIAAAELGYRPVSQHGSLYVYRPTISAGLLAGDISVATHGLNATIVGPKLYVGQLSKRLAQSLEEGARKGKGNVVPNGPS